MVKKYVRFHTTRDTTRGLIRLLIKASDVQSIVASNTTRAS